MSRTAQVCPTDISESSESALDDNMLALASATRSRNSKRRMSSSQVLAARIQELAQEASHGNGATPYEPTERGDSWESDSSQGIRSQAVPIVLMTFGVLPWSGESQRFYMSMVYQWGIRALIVLSVVVFFLPTLRPSIVFVVRRQGPCGTRHLGFRFLVRRVSHGPGLIREPRHMLLGESTVEQGPAFSSILTLCVVCRRRLSASVLLQRQKPLVAQRRQSLLHV